MSFEYDFLSLAASIFQILVLGVLPMCSVVILGIYLRRIMIAMGEKRKILARGRSKKYAVTHKVKEVR